MKKFFLSVAILVSSVAISFAQSKGRVFNDNCFAIIAGKDATADGSVLFAHNEDDDGEQMLNFYIAGGSDGVARYLWAEFPGMTQADSYINEYGVAVASDYCPSREDRFDCTDGGVLYEVRQTVAKYATSARHAVSLIGQLVEKRGYNSTGRTYSVADSKEGWVVSVVKGRHWVAKRVPDDQVMSIPNYYTITDVNLADTANFAGSPDIVSYAIERGWYDPSEGEFNFRKAYGLPQRTFLAANNLGRHARVLAFLSDGQYKYDPKTLDFSIVPSRKLTVQDMIDALSLHKDASTGKSQVCVDGENSGSAIGSQEEFCALDGGNTGHNGSVCNDNTVLSTVFQLRGWLPKGIGNIAWMCAGKPCVGIFVPWYLGADKVPVGWSRFADWKEAEEKHLSDAENKRKNYPDGKYWEVVDRWNKISEDYKAYVEEHGMERAEMQLELYDYVELIDKTLVGIPEADATALMNQVIEILYK